MAAGPTNEHFIDDQNGSATVDSGTILGEDDVLAGLELVWDAPTPPSGLTVKSYNTHVTFPDGTSKNASTGSRNVHIFLSPVFFGNQIGTYSFYTTAIFSDNSVSDASDTVTLTYEAPPKVNFSVPLQIGEPPFTVQFTDTSVASPASWSWDFDDGNTSTDENPSHTFETAGTYHVSLTATNEYGSNTLVSPIIVIDADDVTNLVQIGSVDMNGNSSVDVDIGVPIDTSKTFILASSAVSSSNTPAAFLVEAYFPTTGTSISSFRLTTGSTGSGVVYWQVVTMDNISVQHFSQISIGSSDTSVSQTITAVGGTDKVFPIVSTMLNDVIADTHYGLVSADIASTTSVTLTRGASGTAAESTLQVIEFTDDTTVEHQQVSHSSTGSVTTTPTNTVDPTVAFVVFSFSGTTDGAGASPEVYLDSSGNLIVARSGAAGTTTVDAYIINMSAASTEVDTGAVQTLVVPVTVSNITDTPAVFVIFSNSINTTGTSWSTLIAAAQMLNSTTVNVYANSTAFSKPWALQTVQLPFTASSAPTVTTTTPSSITSSGATGGGDVTDDGGATITERGICWSTSSDPTTSDNTATATGTTGSYTADMTGLSASTTYHVRAYAINSVGTSYGDDESFTTDAASSGDWYDNSWAHRVKVTVDHTKVGSTLTDFPVYLDLSTLPSGFFSNVNSDGSDIRVTESDGTTECAVEVVAISTSGSTGEVHFKAPSLSSTADTDFYIYYGNASASAYSVTATYGRNAVWSANYLFVAHLDSGTIADSTGINGDSTENGAASIAGIVGNAADYTTGSENTHWSAATALCSGVEDAMTVSSVLKSTTTWGTAQRSMELQNQIFMLWFSGAGDQGPLIKQSGANHVANMGTLTTNAWHHIAGVFDGSAGTLKAYADGTLNGTTSSLPSTIDGTSGGQDLNIGSDVSSGTSASQYFTGYIDEQRITSDAKSTDWLDAESSNLTGASTFYTVGTQEDQPTGIYSPIPQLLALLI